MALHLPPLVAQLKAAAEPTRLRLLAACAVGELTVSELTRILGQSQPRVSRHLKKLCDAGLLLRFRERHFVYYRVPTAGSVRRLIGGLLEALSPDDPTLAQDSDALKKILAERAERAQAVLSEAAAPAASSALEAVAEQVLAGADLGAIGDLLDIGTGTGRMIKLFGPHARSAVGIDLSSDMLLVARSNLHAAGLGTAMVRHGDMYRLPYPDATFDTVTLDDVLSHADHPARALREAARILKADGQLLIFELVAGDGARTDGRLREWLDAAGLDLRTAQHMDAGDVRWVVHVSGHASDAVAA